MEEILRKVQNLDKVHRARVCAISELIEDHSVAQIFRAVGIQTLLDSRMVAKELSRDKEWCEDR